MKIAFFDSRRYDRLAFEEANQAFSHDITFIEARLTSVTAELARGFDCVCAFVNDQLNEEVLETLSHLGVKLIALRSAGYNHIDLKAAARLKMRVVRVPEYSPYAVAEHATALLLTLNRKIHRASLRIHDLNFSLDGLVGFDLHEKTVGVIGTGKIGSAFCRIMLGFGCRVICSDPTPNGDLHGVDYVSLDQLLRRSDVISLHAPLLPATRHMLDARAFGLMKNGVYLINTSRGALIDTKALIEALKTAKIGAAGLDVYEEEENVFFRDLSEQVLQDDVLARLLTFPNVLITSHQGFLTREALHNIAHTTLKSAAQFQNNQKLQNEVSATI